MRSGSTQFHCRRSRNRLARDSSLGRRCDTYSDADRRGELSPPTEPHQQGPDLHEDSSPRATTRQRNTKDPYDLISSNSKIRALERRETTGRHEFTARRLAYSGAELGRTARGERIRALSSALRAPGPRRTPCVKYDSCAIIYLVTSFVEVLLPRQG